MKRLLLLLMLYIFALFLFAVEIPNVNFVEYTLNNGLKVFIFEDHSVPLVKVEIWYKVGSIDEEEGKTGIAHLLEHTMFNGTNALPKGGIDDLITSVGGSNNAATSYDYTVYYELVPSAKLELALAIEADRMRNLKIDPDDFYREKEVVKQERRMRIENNYIQSGWEELQANAFKGTPLGHFVIGFMEDLERITHIDVRNFYEMFYAPNNAILSISGDVNPEEAIKLVEKYFGEYSPEQVKRPEYAEPKIEGETILKLPRMTRLSLLMELYSIPKADHEDIPAIEALLDIWLNSKNSRVNKELYFNKQLILGTGGFIYDLRIPGMAVIYAFGYKEEDLDAIKDGIDKELERIINEGISEEELKKVKKQMIKSLIFAQKDLKEFSSEIVLGKLRFDNPELYKQKLEKLNQLTSEDIQRVAKKYFYSKNRYVGYIVPKK